MFEYFTLPNFLVFYIPFQIFSFNKLDNIFIYILSCTGTFSSKLDIFFSFF